MEIQRTILIVEDDPGQQQIYSVALSRAGYTTIVKGDPFDGLKWLEQILPDAILIDVMLPGLSGVELLQKLRENPNGEDVPVIVATASSEVHMSDLRPYRVHALMRKPITPSHLVSEVNRIFEPA
jgi:DNA-binding response OmpR family regulator